MNPRRLALSHTIALVNSEEKTLSESAVQLPALALFDFPTALVVSQGGETIAEAGAVDTVFPLASVTKPLAAWAALVAVERGLLRLDAPAGPDGATVRHLLAHASGISFDSDAVLSAPGTRRVYSNRGIDLLGEYLEEATGTDLESWIETTVLEPLGMSSVLVPGAPSQSGSGTAKDLSLFARELAAPTLISRELASQACAPVFPELEGILPGFGRQRPNPFGLGFEVRGQKTPHWTGTHNSPETFGHFGQSGSFIWVDPVAGRQAVFLGERPFSKVHAQAWPQLNDQILTL